MIVETIISNGCTCHIDDSAYREKSPEEISRIIRNFSDLIVEKLQEQKEKTA